MQDKVAGANGSPWHCRAAPTHRATRLKGVLAAVNSATGEVRRLDQGLGASAPQPLPAKDKLVQGQVYQTARGATRWDGALFQPL